MGRSEPWVVVVVGDWKVVRGIRTHAGGLESLLGSRVNRGTSEPTLAQGKECG